MPSFNKLSSNSSILSPLSQVSVRRKKALDTDDIIFNRLSNLDIKERRFRCFFHRSYFVEKQKALRGEQNFHPILLANVAESKILQSIKTKGKEWESRFSDFLDKILSKIPKTEGISSTDIEVRT